ncbi:uncharacterized protein LOC122032240 [Zingiber officinale]|uniref:uncharacterized protein LOC122032240 n=1 Tax=Zingiber officinale TaxID=94328 RepID=UPI001C4A8671|nr:uncharacterized protein LOC122032240 [Zingiber officinale]
MAADGSLPSTTDPSHFSPLSTSLPIPFMVGANPGKGIPRALQATENAPPRASYAAVLKPLSPRASKKIFEDAGEDFKPAIIYNNKLGCFILLGPFNVQVLVKYGHRCRDVQMA